MAPRTKRGKAARARRGRLQTLSKSPTGISGFDQITGGGLPRGRTTLVCGGAGCGKTLFALEYLVRGATDHGEPGVFVAFEETAEELTTNVASLGFDLADLIARKLLVIDYIKVDRSEIEEAGSYDLEGLFVRLALAIDSVKAKRIALDTIEALFSGFDDEAVLRAELRRLFRWLKDRRVTSIITGERGDGTLTRYGLEEYVSDCVLSLDNRVIEQVSTRRLRIVKYRGSAHGANEYPFLIDNKGFSVLPITSLNLNYDVSAERVSSGVPALDDMIEGRGYFRGSSVLISGAAGTGKSSLSAMFANASCRRNERTLLFALEESNAQLVRNMRSIGLDLEGWQRKKLLRIEAARPTVFGLEMHLVTMHKAIEEFAPRAVVLDPISSLITAGSPVEVKSMLVRLFDYLKVKQVTCLVTALTASDFEETYMGISSLIDTWLQVRDIELGAERTRALHLIKSRGMGHSNQVREFIITAKGIDLLPVAVGPDGVLTGSARLDLEARSAEQAAKLEHEAAARQRQIERRRKVLEAQILAMRSELEAEEEETQLVTSAADDRSRQLATTQALISRNRSSLRSERGGVR